MEIKKIGVVGAGTMGLGIAQVCAQSGFQVVFNDIELGIVEKSINRIAKVLSKNVDKEKISEQDKDTILRRIQKSDKLDDMADCDVVIEAIVEDMDIKKVFYKNLDTIVKPEAIFASNTSSLSVSELASTTKRPTQFIGMHFFNPAQVMKLIEVVTPLQVSEATINAIVDLGYKLGKEPVPVKDSPGFVVNRILAMGSNEVPFMLQEGVATPDAIDKCMKLGANWRMGPCELNDLVGLDISIAVRETLFAEFKEDKYRPSQFLYQMIRGGFLGRKTGKGWYEYDDEGNTVGINKSVFK